MSILVGGLGVCGAACLLAPGALAVTAGVAIAGIAQAVAPNIAADIFSRFADWSGKKLRDKGAAAKNNDLRELIAISIENVLDDVIRQQPGGSGGVKLLKSYRTSLRDRLKIAALDARFKGTWEQSVPTFFKARLEDFAAVKALTPEIWEHFLNEIAYQSLDADQLIAFKAAADALYHTLPKQLIGVYRDALEHHPTIFVAVQTAILQEIWDGVSRVESIIESVRIEQKTVLENLDELKVAIRAEFPAEFPEAVNELRILGWTVEWLLRETHKEVHRIGPVLDRIEASLPKKPTGQQLHTESRALAESGNFEQAAIKAEEAAFLYQNEPDTRLRWKASLDAARDWLNHGFDTSLSESARAKLVARAAKSIAMAESVGAPTGELALTKALLASQQHDIEGVIQYATLVFSDASCGDAYQAEALAMRLQGLIFAERIDDALACVEDMEKLRPSVAGEQLFLIEAAWLRTLCAAQLATEDDVTHFIECAERLTAVHPKLRFRTLNTVIHQFSRVAQEQTKPAAAALIFERLTKLKRVTNDCMAQSARVLEAFAAHERNKGADDELKALNNQLAQLLNSACPQTGSRHAQVIRLLESGYSIIKPTDDAPKMAEIASRIAEYSAEAGNREKVELFLGYCDSWIEACKGGTNDGRQREWCSLRAGALLVRGKSFYRLGCRALESKTPAERWFMGAHEATTEAAAFASERRDQMHGNAELFLAEASYWLAEIEVKLGRNQSAAVFFERTRSPAAMANPRFLNRVGMLAWLKEAEAYCYAGDIDRADKVISSLIEDPRIPEYVASQATDFKRYMDENIAPVVNWFSSANAGRIKEIAKRHGLRAAISTQTKYLVDWHERFFSRKGPSLNQGPDAASMREAYEFWGRGGFSRVVAAIRAKPNSAIAVDALICDDIRRFARLLCPLFDTVVVKWKGAIEADLGLRVFPDPAPDGDEFGDFFGGMGFVRCMGDRKTNTTVLMGSSNLLPEEVGVFLATEALPLIRSGRLILLPAPLVGCTQTAIGWTDDMLTRHFLKGVINVASSLTATTRSDQQSINVTQMAIPYIDGVSLPDLAHVLEDVSDSLLPLRSMVFDSLSKNLAHERWAKINSVEGDFRDACRRLEEVLGALRPKSGDSNWSIRTLASSASAVAPGTSWIGSDANTDVLRAVCPIDKDLAPWIPFWRLEGLGGYLDWSCDLDNPSRPATQTVFGPIRHSWIYPGTGGPGVAATRR